MSSPPPVPLSSVEKVAPPPGVLPVIPVPRVVSLNVLDGVPVSLVSLEEPPSGDRDPLDLESLPSGDAPLSGESDRGESTPPPPNPVLSLIAGAPPAEDRESRGNIVGMRSTSDATSATDALTAAE